MNIRRLNASDKELYMELVNEFYHSDAVLHPVKTENHEVMFAELMRSDVYAECYIIEFREKVAGFIMIAKTFSQESGGLVVWIEEIFIREEFRSKGLGSAALEFIEKTVPASRYRLEIEPDNDRARKLYTRLGYKNLPYEQMVKECNL